MVRLFVRHEVKDYAAWRKEYDAFDGHRIGAGVTAATVCRDVANTNLVTVTHDFATLDQARALVGSEQLKTAMMKAGVIGPPEIWFTSVA
jgi:hypothetical protein